MRKKGKKLKHDNLDGKKNILKNRTTKGNMKSVIT